MLRFIGKALASLFLTREAQAALARQRQAKRAKGSERERNIAAIQAQMKDVATPERQELLRRAMEVQRAKQKILADLSDKDRQKLVALAMKKLLREEPRE